MSKPLKDPFDLKAIENFREYIRIPSVHPNIDYEPCVLFIQAQARSLNLSVKVHYFVPKKPVVVVTWPGTRPDLPSILLNSHMDVVPVYEDKWTHPPFSADIDEHNNIQGRGTQDMKSIGIQYLEAVRKMKREKITLKRTLHLCFHPDEEIGGADGAKVFVQSPQFQELKAGFALDESVVNTGKEFVVFNRERVAWQMHIHCPGEPGHGSILEKNTAGEKASYILSKFYAFRKEQEMKLEEIVGPDNNSLFSMGDVTTINLTKLQGGVQTNVIPPEFILTFDCRVHIDVNLKEFEAMVNKWCEEAGSGVWIEYEQKQPQVPATPVDDSNRYFVAFKRALDELGLDIKVVSCPGCTDNRYMRGVGIPALGFSPINNTQILLHNHNEYLGVDTFLRGIEIYYKILLNVANLEA